MCRAIEAGDLDALVELYDPAFTAWTNIGPETGIDATLELLAFLVTQLPERRYDVVRRVAIPDGFLQEHVLRGTDVDGRTVAVPACVIGTVAGGRITHVREYLDPASFAAR